MMPFVFSTYVEVILVALISGIYYLRILHVCGGDPSKLGKSFTSSGILHVCGGDPKYKQYYTNNR